MLLSFLEERDVARRGREAREWLTHDERGRVIGLIVFSVAISIFMSLMATAIVGFVSRRRAVAPEAMDPEADATTAPVEGAPDAIGVPVMAAEEPTPTEGVTEPVA